MPDHADSYALPLLTAEDPAGTPLIVSRFFADAKVVAVMFPAVLATEPTILSLDTPKFVRTGDRFVMRVPPPFIECALATKKAILLTEEWSADPPPPCPTCHAPRSQTLPQKGAVPVPIIRSQMGKSALLAPGEMLMVEHDGIVGQVRGLTFSGEPLCAECLGKPTAGSKKRSAKCSACGNVVPSGSVNIIVCSLRVGHYAVLPSNSSDGELPACAIMPGMIRSPYAHPGQLVTFGVRNASKDAVRLQGVVYVDGPALASDWDKPYTIGATHVRGSHGGLVEMFPTASTPQAQIHRSDVGLVTR